jgi:tetratricopeptide (TPR) repeat protein
LREQAHDIWSAQAIVCVPNVLAARGDIAALQAMIGDVDVPGGWAAVEQAAKVARAVRLRESGRADEIDAEQTRDAVLAVITSAVSDLPPQFAEAVDCLLAAGRPELVQELLDRIDALEPAELIPLLEAEASRARARLAVLGGDRENAQRWYKRAVSAFREFATPFHLARAQLEYAELLASPGGDSGESVALRDEAIKTFEALDAKPWLERAEVLGSVVAA